MKMSLAILGSPVEHSLSPIIQRAAFDYAGIEGTYERRDVGRKGMAAAIDEIRSGELTGANVTMPHKRLAASLADDLVGDARRMGAANTVWLVGDRVTAASTDPDGVRWAWEYAGLPDDGPVLVVGSGGAAVAALVALEGRALRVTARRQDAARQTVTSLHSDASVLPWGSALPGAVVVNATPIGMKGERLPGGVLDGAVGLLEMTYGRAVSSAVATMRSRSLPVATGKHMLVGQGVASFARWTGLEIPHSVMLEAIATAESGR